MYRTLPKEKRPTIVGRFFKAMCFRQYPKRPRSKLCKYFFVKESLNSFGRNREKLIIKSYANTLLTVAHAERACQGNLIAHIVVGNQFFQRFNHSVRSFDMARTTNTYRNFHSELLKNHCARLMRRFFGYYCTTKFQKIQ